MFSRTHGFYIIAIAMLGLSVLMGYNMGVAQVGPEGRPITLLRAWDIIATRAGEWRSAARIGRLQSMDAPGDAPTVGVDGRRRAWLATIIDPNSQSTQLRVRLLDEAITEEIEQPLPVDPKASLEKPTIDSPEAVELAKAEKPDIAPARGKGQGFHFMLESGQITVQASLRGEPFHIQLNSFTGKVVSSQVRTFGGSGGVIYSTDGGQTWAASSLNGRMVKDIYPDPLKEGQAYATVMEEGLIHIYETRDEGKTWDLTSDLPGAAGNWAFALTGVVEPTHRLTLIVGTASGLWLARDGKTWSRADALPEGPKQWIGAVRNDKGYRVFVSITAGTHKGLYASSDLARWTKESAIPYRLSESYDRKTVLAADEAQRGPTLLLTGQRRKVIELPEVVMGAAGAFDGSAPMILSGPEGIGQRVKSAGKSAKPSINWTLHIGPGPLAAAPDFPTNPVAIVGGFRTGIYRTQDGGKTWNPVLLNPSALIEGNGEIYSVKFLSPKTVTAVIGGNEQWKKF